MSPIKLLNTLLLIAAVIGGVLTYRAAQTYQEVVAEQERLEIKLGLLTIEDPSKIHVRAFETGEPLHFAWRIYMPAGSAIEERHGNRVRGRSIGLQPREFVMTARFRESDEGILRGSVMGAAGSSWFELGNWQLADLLRDRWDEIQVEQLGGDHLVVVEPDEVAILFRLTFSEQLKHEAEHKLSKRDWERFQKALVDYRVGPEEALRQAMVGQPSADQ